MNEAITQLITAGPLGIFVVYLVWERQRNDRTAASERVRRDKLDADRIETDKALAGSLATLATLIQGMSR